MDKLSKAAGEKSESSTVYSNETIYQWLSSCFEYDRSVDVWSDPQRHTFAYSDGDEVEDYIAASIKRSADRSCASAQLNQCIKNWPSNYHLSGLRGNLLRPIRHQLKGRVLEIGCGMGAITRFLGENECQVVAVEGSSRRASIASQRCSDLANVQVVASDFNLLPPGPLFDVVTLIGVLEYAPLFSDQTASDAINDLLAKARSYLRPGGLLIVAIENRLGLKYFAGAPEEHVNAPMFGLEGRYTDSTPVTFGREELKALLFQQGLVEQQWWYPQPSYKLPVSLISHEGLQGPVDLSGLAAEAVRHDQLGGEWRSFELERAWASVHLNNLMPDLANAFLILATDQTVFENKVLAVHYGGVRKRQFLKETVFERLGDEVIVRSAPLYESVAGADDELVLFAPKSEPFLNGRNWQAELAKIVGDPNWDLQALSEWAHVWFDGLMQAASIDKLSVVTPNTQIDGGLLDAIPRNMKVTADRVARFFDQEWVYRDPLTIGYVAYRGMTDSLFNLENCAPPKPGVSLSRRFLLEHIFASLGWKLTAADLTVYAEKEDVMQLAITGGIALKVSQLDARIPIRRTFNEALSALSGGSADNIVELRERIANSADDIRRLNFRCASLSAQLDQALARCQQLTPTTTYADETLGQISAIQAELSQVLKENSVLKARINTYHESKSWRLTAPLRRFVSLLRHIRHCF